MHGPVDCGTFLTNLPSPTTSSLLTRFPARPGPCLGSTAVPAASLKQQRLPKYACKFVLATFYHVLEKLCLVCPPKLPQESLEMVPFLLLIPQPFKPKYRLFPVTSCRCQRGEVQCCGFPVRCSLDLLREEVSLCFL